MSEITAYLSAARSIIRNARQICAAAPAVANVPSGQDSDQEVVFTIAEDDNESTNDGIRAEYQLFEIGDAVWGGSWGGDNANVSIDVLGYEVSGAAYAELGFEELELGVTGSASAYAVQAEANLAAGPLNAGAEGMVGATASAEAGLEYNFSDGTLQAEFGGEAYAGAKAEASTGLDLHLVGGEVGADVRAGIGADFEFDVGFEDWEFQWELDAGAALGLGFGFDTSVSVDVGAFADGAGDVGGWTMDRVTDAPGWIGDRGSDIKDGLGKIGSVLNPLG